MRTDEELLRALCSEGDTSAFDELYARSASFVYRVALRVAGNDADAADVTQSAFQHVLEKGSSLELRGRLTTYLYPVTIRLARRAREKAAANLTDQDAFEEAVDSVAALESGNTSEDREAFAARVASLPDAQREILLLRFAEDLTVEECAEALGCPPGTVRSRTHYALLALRAVKD